MISAILLGLFVSLFMGITMFYGASYSLSAKSSNWLGTAMPILLMIPRFLLALGSLFVGIALLGWGKGEVTGYVSIIGGIWVLLVTAEVFYVQHKLKGRKYEKIEVEKVQSKQVRIPYRTISDTALVSYEARQRCKL